MKDGLFPAPPNFSGFREKWETWKSYGENIIEFDALDELDDNNGMTAG